MKMYSLYISAVAVMALAACGRKSHTEAGTEGGESVYKPRHAVGYSISGAEGRAGSVIRTSAPWQNAGDISTSVFMARSGEEPPEDFTGEVVRGEAKRIVAMSSTHIAMLETLGAADRIVGVSGIDFIASPAIAARRDSISDVGYDGNIDYEALAGRRPDIVLLYGVSGASPMEGKLKELGIPFMYVGDYVEESPLGKMEWIVALGELTGLRGRAIEIADSISDNYERLSRMAKERARGTRAVSVMLNAPYGDSWFMPPEKSYMVRLINDAGGSYAYNSGGGTATKSIEKEDAYLLTSEADVWLNAGRYETLDELRRELPRWAGLEVVKNGKVYNNTARKTAAGGNDFFESGTVHPDVVLRDLINIIMPGVAEDSTPVYYKRLP